MLCFGKPEDIIHVVDPFIMKFIWMKKSESIQKWRAVWKLKELNLIPAPSQMTWHTKKQT